jgi:ABC-type transporter Mla MlaB component
MGITLKRSGKKDLIQCSGELTLDHAEELRSALIKALIDVDRVELDMEKVTAVDLSCLQLLCSAHRSAVRMNKLLALRHGRPDELNRAADEAGYLRRAGCRLDSYKTCLWRVS